MTDHTNPVAAPIPCAAFPAGAAPAPSGPASGAGQPCSGLLPETAGPWYFNATCQTCGEAESVYNLIDDGECQECFARRMDYGRTQREREQRWDSAMRADKEGR